MQADDWVAVARVDRSRGRRGEVAVTAEDRDPARFLGKEFRVAGAADQFVTVEEAWLHGDRLVLKFQGIDSIDAAEQLRGAELCVRRSGLAELDEGEYYLADLVGFKMIDATTGHPLGNVKGWSRAGPTAILEVEKPDGSEMLVPFVRAICRRVDVHAGSISVELPEGLEELNQ